MLVKKSVFVIGLVIFVFSFIPTTLNAYLGEEEDLPIQDRQVRIESEARLGADGTIIQEGRTPDQQPQYVPGEVLIKFKEGAEPDKILQFLGIEAQSISRIFSLKPALNRYRENLKIDKTKSGWYWFKGKNYKSVRDISDDALFDAAYADMTPEEKALADSYKINIAGDLSVEDVSAKLEQDPHVEYAHPNYKYYTDRYYTQEFPETLPDDTYVNPTVDNMPGDGVTWSFGAWEQDYEDLWGIKNIKADKAWKTTQGMNVIIAIIDSGVDYNHPDLTGNIWVNEHEIPDNGIDDDGNGYIDDYYGFDFANSSDNNRDGDYDDPVDVIDSDPMDGNGHGTHVAGTVAAIGNNAEGVIGVAPRARIMSVKGFRDDGSGSTRNLAKGIEYAASFADENTRVVLSNSWGSRLPIRSNPTVEKAIDYAYSRGCVVVFAAGNESRNVSSPANYDKTIAVAAIDHTDAKASFSNYGYLVDVAAPGVDILSLRAEGTDMYLDGGTRIVGDNEMYYRANGTSMSCPHVAGLAALILSQHPDYTPEQVRWVLKNTVRTSPDLTGDFTPEFGIIDAEAAVGYTGVPPQLTGKVSIEDVDYIADSANIRFTAGGEDFAGYELKYRQATDGALWNNLQASSTAAQDEVYVWSLNNLTDDDYIICLSLTTAAPDVREKKIYAKTTIDRNSNHSIEPEIIFYTYDSSIDSVVQGLCRLGGTVLLRGRAVGTYELQWKKKGSSDAWSNLNFSYDVDDGYLGRWDTSSITEEGIYLVRLSDNVSTDKYTEIRLDEDLKEGFPIAFDRINVEGDTDFYDVYSHMANVDSDDELEIISVRSNDKWARVYVYEHDGALKTGWPVVIDKKYGNSSYPALADVNGDGNNEILFTTTYTWDFTGLEYKSIFCLDADNIPDADNGHIVFQRDFPAADGKVNLMRDPLIVADLDNDSQPEIIYRHWDTIYILNGQGEDISLIPLQVGDPVPKGGSNYMCVGNFDDDTDYELCVVQNEGYVKGAAPGRININVFNIDGSDVTGWPRTIDNRVSLGAISCGDMDGDDRDEIFVTGRYENIIDGKYAYEIYVLRHDGSMLFTKTVDSTYGHSIMADIDGVPGAEVIFQTGDKLEVLDSAGNSVDSWQYDNAQRVIPYFAADIDNDNEIEIGGLVYQTDTFRNKIIILDAEGNEELSNPLNNKIISVGVPTLEVDDLDKDGYEEVLVKTHLPALHEGFERYYPLRNGILVYETQAFSNPRLAHWRGPQHDIGNTCGYRPFSGEITIDSIDPSVTVTSPTQDEILPSNWFTIAGTATDNISEINQVNIEIVNSLTDKTAIANVTDGSFSYNAYMIGDGENTIRVSADDEAGNQGSDVVTASIDTRGPTVTITEPQFPSTVLDTGFQITGTAQDPSGVDQVFVRILDHASGTVTVNDAPASYNSETDTWSFTVLPEHITAGARVGVYVRALDTVGHYCAYTGGEVDVVSPPQINYLSPTGGAANSYVYIPGSDFGAQTASSRVEFSGAGGSADAYIYYWYNRDTYAYVSCKVPDLALGTYQVKVINDIGASEPVNYEIMVPAQINITSPVYNARVSNEGFIVEGTTVNGSSDDIAEIRVSVYDYGRRTYTVSNQLANYDPSANTWQFQVLPTQVTGGQRVYIRVQANDASGAYLAYKYTIANVLASAPAITGLSVTSGAPESFFRISGRDFGATLHQVEFSSSGSIPAYAHVYWWQNEAIGCSVPVVAPGTYDVTVITAGGRSNSYQFTVVAKPVVTITSPTSSTVLYEELTFAGSITSSLDITEVRVYISNYREWAVRNGLANYDSGTKTWSFQVLPEHMIAGSWLRLWVNAKDSAGTWTGWKYVYVTVGA